MRKLAVSDNGHFLMYEDGAPFFYLGDTAWELFHRLDLSASETYLRRRAAQGFTVIQAVALAESNGLDVPNQNGDLPLLDGDPTRPNDAYFAHVDRVVALAESLGLTIGMLPTWGDKWHRAWGAGPEVFTPENARAYGLWLGRRYAEASLIWILGGDRPVETDTHRAILRSMAVGLREGDGGRHLITFHPTGWQSSLDSLAEEPWLDFHMCQSGHGRNNENWRFVDPGWAHEPAKPFLDGEPGYEDHMAGFKPENGYLDDWDVRKAAYWSLFAGSCGHTYGCHPIWQFWQPGRAPYTWARRPWFEALDLPGAWQVRHARALIEARPMVTRVPDQSLIVSEVGAGVHHVRACRDEARSYALVYLPLPEAATIDLGKLDGSRVRVSWYDPRTGASQDAGAVEDGGEHEFAPPVVGPDWVLVLEAE